MQTVILRERRQRVRQMCLMPCDRGAEKLMKFLRRAMKKADNSRAGGNGPIIKEKEMEGAALKPVKSRIGIPIESIHSPKQKHFQDNRGEQR